MAKGTVNRVIILGRLGQDPEARSTANGTQVVNLNVATNELGRADEQGNRPDLTEWHRIVLFGRMAENAAQYLKTPKFRREWMNVEDASLDELETLIGDITDEIKEGPWPVITVASSHKV